MSRFKRKQRKIVEPVLQDMFDNYHEFDDNPDDIEQRANETLDAFLEAPFSKKKQLEYKWQQYVAKAVYRKYDVRDIPTEDLILIAHLTADSASDTFYADRIKSPVSAIRAKCVTCMSGQASFVRNCTNVVCLLFPFRMGNNPFYGKLEDADVDSVDDFNEEELHDADQEA